MARPILVLLLLLLALRAGPAPAAKQAPSQAKSAGEARAANLSPEPSPGAAIIVNGNTLPGLSALLIEEKFFLPAAPVVKALGGKVEWQHKEKLLVICRGGLCFPIQARNNPKARIVENRAYLLADRLAELLECKWGHDPKQKAVILTSQPKGGAEK